MQHLIETHHLQRFAFIRGREGHESSRERFQAYLDILRKYQIPFDPNLVVETDDIFPSEAVRAIEVLFDQRKLRPKEDVEAILTVSDVFSSVVVDELNRRGIKVPNDVAVVGFNNRLESYQCWPPLTTVDVDFYQTGYVAVENLLKQIHHLSCPETTRIPAKLIIRQSCGCFERSIRRTTATPTVTHAQTEPSTITIAERNRLIEAISADSELPADPIRKFISVVIDFFEKNGDKVELLHTLGDYINQTKKIPCYLLHWQNVVTELRKLLLPELQEKQLFHTAEDLWHQIRILLFKSLEYTFPKSFFFDLDPNHLAQVGGLFNDARNLEELTTLISQELLSLNIPGCYLALYENPANPKDKARLILAFNEEGRISEAENQSFPSYQILPQRFLNTSRRVSYLIESCFYKDRELGYVVFEMGPLEGALYEFFRANFNSSLHSALTIEEQKRIEKEREELLRTLEIKNRELEDKNEDIKKVNHQLKQAIEDTKLANEAKSRFLANISHEIRTPLNCIIGFAEIMKNTIHIEERQRYLNLIVDESEKMLELINQLLDISKIETGKLRLVNEPFNLREVMESITSAYSTLAHNKGLTYRVHIAEDIPETLMGDALRLRQILINLIGNAIKFTFKGHISTDVKMVSHTDTEITLRFEIEDTGIGIPADKQQLIFEPFVQAEDTTTRKFGGTGLGTSISKELVELMHGQIGVNSHPGIGSTFWFTARFEKTSSSASPASFLFNEPLENIPLIPNAQILLVEDYPTNREVALAHLKNLGCSVHIAENGKIAVEKFRKNPVDLILMDVQMPEMDGYQATQLIRTLPGGQSVPIIGMTANAFDSDLSNCFKFGMNDVITKPFRKKLFLEKVVDWLSFTDNSPTNQDSSPSRTPSETNATPLPSGHLPLDWERTLEEFDNDQPFILNLIREFVTHGRKQLQIIQDAIAVQDGTTIYREAHAIKGGAENLNARLLAEAARSLEYLGKNNRLNHPNISEIIETIREELNQLETFTMEICP
ncbi:MAG TPA: ATP-binding protein [Bacillota bacterium]|nr:ATP-binding protein [Bacillota bacterium]